MSTSFTGCTFERFEKGSILCRVKVELNGDQVLNCLLIKGSRGPFLTLPRSYNEKTKKYYNLVWFEDEEILQDINDQVVAKYFEEFPEKSNDTQAASF